MAGGKAAVILGESNAIAISLAAFLQARGYRVSFSGADCMSAHEIYVFPEKSGGVEFKTRYLHAMRDNSIGSVLLLDRNIYRGDARIFMVSSSEVYPEQLQSDEGAYYGAEGLKEDDAWWGVPPTSYGVERLFSERLFLDYGRRRAGVAVRIGRLFGVFGPGLEWRGWKAGVVGALCGKVAEAKLNGEESIVVYGDGMQLRSFLYIDDCVEMMYAVMHSECDEPVNIGRPVITNIDQLVDMIKFIAGVNVKKEYDSHLPVGVEAKCADVNRYNEYCEYRPRWSLKDGLIKTYEWVEKRVEEFYDESRGSASNPSETADHVDFAGAL